MRPSSARPTAGAASRWASSSSVSCAPSARNSIASMPSARGPPCATSRARPRRSYPARFGLDPRRRSGRLTEDRPEDSVRLPDLLGPPPAGDEREDLLRVLARHLRRLVGAHVGQLAERNLQRHRYVVQAVDGDRLLAALDLADELAGQAGAIAQPLLAESALLAERPQPLPQELPYVFHRAFAHGWLP